MSMYNAHRGMGPAPGPGNTRLNDLLESVRAEFETQARASGDYEHSSTSFQCLDHDDAASGKY
jgi:glucose repression regulatory protein TUP1